jgi:hypothetical protein
MFKSECETVSDCRLKLHKFTLDLITRQQAEIEEWKKINQRLYDEMEERRKEDIGIAKGYARIGAIKELAGKVADVFYSHDKGDAYVREVVYNLVKEMVGEK